MGVGQVDDHLLRVAGIVELINQIVARREEQRAADPVPDTVDGPVAVMVAFHDLLHGGQVRHPPGEQHRAGEHPHDHAVSQI